MKSTIGKIALILSVFICSLLAVNAEPPLPGTGDTSPGVIERPPIIIDDDQGMLIVEGDALYTSYVPPVKPKIYSEPQKKYSKMKERMKKMKEKREKHWKSTRSHWFRFFWMYGGR